MNVRTDTGDFVGVAEAAEQVGLTTRDIVRKSRRGGVQLWRSGIDSRRLLIRRSDLTELLSPKPHLPSGDGQTSVQQDRDA